MADLLIRDIPEQVMTALSEKAQGAGLDRTAYVRQKLTEIASEPIVKERYAYRVYGKSGKGIIRRLDNHPNGVGGGCSNFSEEEFEAYNKAQDYMRRNGVGDREEAVSILKNAFEEVFEVAV
jgi:hypothetical protein